MKTVKRYDVTTGIIANFIKSTTGWDTASDVDMQYYGAELKVDIGSYKKGTIVPTIVIGMYDFAVPIIQIYSEDGESYDEFEVEFAISFSEVTQKPSPSNSETR